MHDRTAPKFGKQTISFQFYDLKFGTHTIICNVKWAATWQNQQSDCAPSEDSDQPGHSSSLIRVFAVHMKKAWVLSYPLSVQWRLGSDWADAQADLRLGWVHSHFVGFVMSRLRLFSFGISYFLLSLLDYLEDSWNRMEYHNSINVLNNQKQLAGSSWC